MKSKEAIPIKAYWYPLFLFPISPAISPSAQTRDKLVAMKNSGKLDTRSTRLKIYETIFESDTPAGKFFDIALFIVIILSILTVLLESMQPLRSGYLKVFRIVEWVFTILFTIEYALRLYSISKPLKYALSFYGIIDLLALIPTYLTVVMAGAHSLLVIRSLRLLRVFRIFKLGSFMKQSSIIYESVIQSRNKIAVFMYFVLIMVTIIGALMYVIEGPTNDSFDSIPTSIYWAIVTLTTVGYGDIIPMTGIGKFISAAVMILGYAVIAVPTGIVSAQIINAKEKINGQACPHCSKEGHDNDAIFCKKCGGALHE